MNEAKESFSMALRVRRVSYEDAYVAVPVTAKLTETRQDFTVGINAEAFLAEALIVSKSPNVEWGIESREVAPHPEQRDAPEGRRRFDSVYTADAEPLHREDSPKPASCAFVCAP